MSHFSKMWVVFGPITGFLLTFWVVGGIIRAVQWFFQKRPFDLNSTRDGSDQTLLHMVVRNRVFSRKAIRALVAYGLDVNARDVRGQTPLHVAAECSNVEAMYVLLELDADPCITDNVGNTFLHLFAWCNKHYGDQRGDRVLRYLVRNYRVASEIVNKKGYTYADMPWLSKSSIK